MVLPMTDPITHLRLHAFVVTEKTVWTFVEVETAEGLVGTGEATLGGRKDALSACFERRRPGLLGRPASVASLPASWRESGDLASTAVACALDQALWDIAGQRAGKSVAALLTSEPLSQIAVYANINRRTGDRTPEGFAASARLARAAGFDAVKIAPFDGLTPATPAAEAGRLLADGIARTAAVRQAIGGDARLLVDCHWRLGPETADQLLAEAEALGLYWIECPFPEEAPVFAQIRRFRARANDRGILTAGCELMTGVAGFAPILQAGLYDVIMPDVKYAGGLAAVMDIAAAAERSGVACSPHNPSGPICHGHSVQASAAVPGFLILEMQFDETPRFEEIVVGDLPLPASGRIQVPDRPGLGLGLAASKSPDLGG
jgi:galactonate dehydratase